jgi:hypothetical protein
VVGADDADDGQRALPLPPEMSREGWRKDRTRRRRLHDESSAVRCPARSFALWRHRASGSASCGDEPTARPRRRSSADRCGRRSSGTSADGGAISRARRTGGLGSAVSRSSESPRLPGPGSSAFQPPLASTAEHRRAGRRTRRARSARPGTVVLAFRLRPWSCPFGVDRGIVRRDAKVTSNVSPRQARGPSGAGASAGRARGSLANASARAWPGVDADRWLGGVHLRVSAVADYG